MFRSRMSRGNLRLQVICGELIASRRLFQVQQTEMDHGAIPQAAVLFFEEKQISQRIGSGGKARRLEKHQRQERMALRLSGGGIFGQRFSEADRLGAQVIFNQAVSSGGRITFGKKEVKNFEHRVQTLVELLGIGNL